MRISLIRRPCSNRVGVAISREGHNGRTQFALLPGLVWKEFDNSFALAHDVETGVNEDELVALHTSLGEELRRLGRIPPALEGNATDILKAVANDQRAWITSLIDAVRQVGTR